MSNKPKVAIVLVNWNSSRDTLECLTSLSHVQYDNTSIVVVDNGSTGDDVTRIRAEHPNLPVIETVRNLGFSGGNNVGISFALEHDAQYILCLNNDTTVASDFLTRMVEAIEADPQAGIVTSSIFSHSQPEHLLALGCWICLGSIMPVGHIRDVPEAVLCQDNAIKIPFAEGCVLMMRREVAIQTCGFDERFFAYTEDADLCLRAQQFGWYCIAVPKSHVWHKVGDGKDSGMGSPAAWYYTQRNIVKLVSRHGTRTQRNRFRKAELKWFVSALFHQSALFPFNLPDLHRQLLPQVLGMFNAHIGFFGSKERWSKINEVVTKTVIGILYILSISRKLLMPLCYGLSRRVKTRESLQTIE